jgi:hypothetical protein
VIFLESEKKGSKAEILIYFTFFSLASLTSKKAS